MLLWVRFEVKRWLSHGAAFPPSFSLDPEPSAGKLAARARLALCVVNLCPMSLINIQA